MGPSLEKVRSFRELLAWQRAIDLVDQIYQCTSRWPTSETYGLTSQTRRAVVSVPANIAEGQGRNGTREFIHHLGIARGSLFEVETMLVICGRPNLLYAAKLSVLIALIHEVGRLITALMHSLEERLRRAK